MKYLHHYFYCFYLKLSSHFFGDQKEPIAYNAYDFLYLKEADELIIYLSKNKKNYISILKPKHIHNSSDYFAIESAKKITVNIDLGRKYGIYRKEYEDVNTSPIEYTKFFHIKKINRAFCFAFKITKEYGIGKDRSLDLKQIFKFGGYN